MTYMRGKIGIGSSQVTVSSNLNRWVSISRYYYLINDAFKNIITTDRTLRSWLY
jgi:hypothetical protein